MGRQNDLIDMTKEKVNALTDDQVMVYLREIDEDVQRIREELRQIRREQEEHQKRMAAHERIREKNRLKIENARKRAAVKSLLSP
jgi:succinate dehydrogenase/fumarate reductase flavoprotein subunit